MTHKPFRDLSDAEKGALLLAHHEGKIIEAYGCGEWYPAKPAWGASVPYRIAPEPKTPDSINWDHVSDGLNFLARDTHGFVNVYYASPRQRASGWDDVGDLPCVEACAFASYRRGTVDWKDSLVIRPGYKAAQ